MNLYKLQIIIQDNILILHINLNYSSMINKGEFTLKSFKHKIYELKRNDSITKLNLAIALDFEQVEFLTHELISFLFSLTGICVSIKFQGDIAAYNFKYSNVEEMLKKTTLLNFIKRFDNFEKAREYLNPKQPLDSSFLEFIFK